jgi:Tol biopolymer transport system component
MSEFPPIQWIQPAGDWPSFSPDGSQVVFTLAGALYTVDVSGTNLKRLYPAEGTVGVVATRPDWSWNASAIAFTYNNSEIWTVVPTAAKQLRIARPRSKPICTIRPGARISSP